MDLKGVLAVLSKSSPHAVTTDGEPADPLIRKIKRYLYVTTDIEKAFSEKLAALQANEIIFLCGSSGDGKSEILSKYKQQYEGIVHFHLDATHSFEPNKTAIEELDDLFNRQDKPLVVGINTGMLANYQREGSDVHRSIKDSIESFEQKQHQNGRVTFFDFEAYPKFSILDGQVLSNFFSDLLDRVVKEDTKNPFREFYEKALSDPSQEILVTNFTLLSNRFVQKTIIELLLSARIVKDQFITARMLLDFIYCILTGAGNNSRKGYLFDNLFNGGDNELLQALQGFDPSLKRNRQIDEFILNSSLDFPNKELDQFVQECRERRYLRDLPEPNSLIRLFYLFKEVQLSHNYHYKFSGAFDAELWTEYRRIWEMHRKYAGEPEHKRELRKFYDEIVVKAINKYANRNAPYLSKDQFYISSHGDVDLASELDITACYRSVEENKDDNLSFFCMFLKVGNTEVERFPVSINLLGLMMKVVNGFRPNKHDKSCVVLLEELVSKIAKQASLSDTIFLYARAESNPIRLRHNTNDSEIRVSGL